MSTSTNTTKSGTAPTSKQVYMAEEKVDEKTVTVAGSSDKSARKSDEAKSEISESGVGGGEGSKKKEVWNKAKNGGVEVVMGADSWPALSDKGKAPLKSSVESSKSVTEVVVPILQGAPTERSRKQVTTNSQPNSIQNNTHPARQKSFKRHGGNISNNTSSPTQPLPSPPPFSQPQSSSVPYNQSTTNAQKNFESAQKVISDPQLHGTNERPQHNNSQRKGTGPHQQGDGSYNHRYGARKDQDRPNRYWNNQGSNNGRDTYPQPTGALPRGINKHLHMPHNSGMYVAPPLSPTVRPFGPVGYPEFPLYYLLVPPESMRGFTMPYPPTGPHQMVMQHSDPELYSKVVNQIEYYFSNDNLVKDIYLRNNMDEEGWVSVELIAGFKQVKKLTNNIAFIMEAIQSSTVVEVKDDKVRRRNDWSKWLVPGSLKIPSPSAYRDPGSSSPLAARIQKLNVGEENTDIPSASSPSGEPSMQRQGYTILS